ncbi:MAG: hypothetical protein CMH83_13490 [Nocardioides sp.]|nr:hypothetical protein [Nocardioides sp.]
MLAGPVPAPSATAVPSAAPTTTARAETPRAETVRLDGVRVRLRRGTTQVVTVKHTRGHHARVRLWVLRERGWRLVETAYDGRTGYGGLVRGNRRRQGTGTTPLGTYPLTSSFGTQRRDARWDLPHRRIRPGDYWVQDNASRFYNRYRNKRQGGFRWWLPSGHADSSERLADYPRQYEHALVLDYNPRQVRHRGSGIFLHVNGRGATAGCISAPRPFLRLLLRRLDPDERPLVAVGR